MARTGATSYGVAAGLRRLAGVILRDERTVLAVSNLAGGDADLADVCPSLPTVVGRGGCYGRGWTRGSARGWSARRRPGARPSRARDRGSGRAPEGRLGGTRAWGCWTTGSRSSLAGRAASGPARRFAREGARVALADVQREEGERLRGEIEAAGGRALCVDCDVSDPPAVERAIGAAVDYFGTLDIVFANAGINGVWAPIEGHHATRW